MSAISQVLVQQSHLQIFSSSRSTGVDLKGWIANQNYFIDADITADSYCLRASDKEYLKAALANDCNRMAMAAIESIAGIQADGVLKKSGAWGVIRAYYASFFAAHSIMRMFGVSCSQLDQKHVNKIFEVGSAVGKDGGLKRLDKGFYTIKVDRSFNGVVFHKYKDSHKDTWGEFLKLIESLIDSSPHVSALGKYKVEVMDVLLSVRRGLTQSRCTEKGNWLSHVRNSVNYQHTHGVWFPYEKKPVAPKYLNALASGWVKPVSELDFSFRKSDIESFFEISLVIIAFFRELLISCSLKAVDCSPIFTNGCLRLLKTIRAV